MVDIDVVPIGGVMAGGALPRPVIGWRTVAGLTVIEVRMIDIDLAPVIRVMAGGALTGPMFGR